MTRSPKRGPVWLEPALQTLRAHYFDGPAPECWEERDWARATGAALAERLGPALSEAATACGVQLPQGCWAALTAARLESQRRASVRESVLDRLAPAMERCGLAAAVFKGPALARHYPDPRVREAVDLDLLVPPNQLALLETALSKVGFQRWAGGGRPRSHYAVMYTQGSSAEGEVVLDLHPSWHDVALDDTGNTVSIGAWHARMASARLGQHAWRVLPPAAELYLAAAHSVLSSFRTLSIYLDLAMLASAIDPEAAERASRAARATGRDRHLRHALTLAGDLFGCEVVPGHVSLPARLGIPLGVRVGYLGQGFRFLPSSLVMELLMVRGVRRKLGFLRWVLGHRGEEEAGAGSEGLGPRPWRILGGFRWLRGTLVRYRVPGAAALRR